MPEKNKSASAKEFVKIVMSLLPNFKKLVLIFISIILVAELLKFIPVYLVSLIVDGLIESQDITYLMTLIASIFIVLTISVLVEILLLSKVITSSTVQQKSLMNGIFAKILKLPLSWHEKRNTGDLVSKVQKSSAYINQLIWFLSREILPSLIQLFLTGAILFWVDWRFGIIYIIFTPIILYTINNQFKKVQPIREKYHKEYDKATKNFAQSLYNIKTVKDYVQEDREYAIHEENLDKYIKYTRQRASYEYWQIAFRDTMTNLVRVGSMALAVYLVYIGEITAGTLVFIFTIVEKAYLNLFRLGHIYSFMGDTYESLNRTLEIKESENKLKDDGKLKPDNSEIKFENMSFEYDEHEVLKNINVVIPETKTTALVGPSGSGKSTFVQLIMRHYDPTKGKIKLGNIDLKEIPLNELRKRISFVSQHTEIFDRTAFENIAYGKLNATREEVISASKKANAHNFIKTFKKDYDTILGERGVRLSGGQQQRISIARALLSNSDIIVFDEATSSLDSESEKAIQNALIKIKHKTVIIIAHRLSTIEHADNILVLKNGNIIEQGTHNNLVKKEGVYNKMIKLQKLGELRE